MSALYYGMTQRRSLYFPGSAGSTQPLTAATMPPQAAFRASLGVEPTANASVGWSWEALPSPGLCWSVFGIAEYTPHVLRVLAVGYYGKGFPCLCLLTLHSVLSSLGGRLMYLAHTSRSQCPIE